VNSETKPYPEQVKELQDLTFTLQSQLQESREEVKGLKSGLMGMMDDLHFGPYERDEIQHLLTPQDTPTKEGGKG